MGFDWEPHLRTRWFWYVLVIDSMSTGYVNPNRLRKILPYPSICDDFGFLNPPWLFGASAISRCRASNAGGSSMRLAACRACFALGWTVCDFSPTNLGHVDRIWGFDQPTIEDSNKKNMLASLGWWCWWGWGWWWWWWWPSDSIVGGCDWQRQLGNAEDHGIVGAATGGGQTGIHSGLRRAVLNWPHLIGGYTPHMCCHMGFSYAWLILIMPLKFIALPWIRNFHRNDDARQFNDQC